jgi:hypothetical protein
MVSTSDGRTLVDLVSPGFSARGLGYVRID